jgi:hypothetical protein
VPRERAAGADVGDGGCGLNNRSRSSAAERPICKGQVVGSIPTGTFFLLRSTGCANGILIRLGVVQLHGGAFASCGVAARRLDSGKPSEPLQRGRPGIDRRAETELQAVALACPRKKRANNNCQSQQRWRFRSDRFVWFFGSYRSLSLKACRRSAYSRRHGGSTPPGSIPLHPANLRPSFQAPLHGGVWPMRGGVLRLSSAARAAALLLRATPQLLWRGLFPQSES